MIELNEKQALQEAEYDNPIHWNLIRAEGLKYRCLSRLIASLIASVPEVKKEGRVTLVDLGCGDGASTCLVTEAVRAKGIEIEAHGFDYSDRAIKIALEKSKEMENPPAFSVQIVETMTSVPEGSGHVVVLMREVLEHLTDEQIDDTLGKLRDLYPSFHLLATTPSDNSPCEPKHYRHYSEDYLASTLERNQMTDAKIRGFSFRPEFLFPLLSRMKSGLNRRPFFWRFTRPLWCTCPPSWAQTLVALSRYSRKD